MGTAIRILVAAGIALVVSWLALLAYLWIGRPRRVAMTEAVRLLPDTVSLLRRIAADRDLDRGVRARLWILFAYLAVPLDLVPDFIPVIGHADDALVVAATLRSVVRRAGPDAVRRHWRGTPDGLATLWRLARLPGDP